MLDPLVQKSSILCGNAPSGKLIRELWFQIGTCSRDGMVGVVVLSTSGRHISIRSGRVSAKRVIQIALL